VEETRARLDPPQGSLGMPPGLTMKSIIVAIQVPDQSITGDQLAMDNVAAGQAAPSPALLLPFLTQEHPMPRIEERLARLGLVLPAPFKVPPGVVLPFQFVRIVDSRAFLSGHGPQNADGSIAEPLGKVVLDLTVEQGYAAARLTALSMLGSLKRALGDLDRIAHWQRVFGMVNSAPGFNRQPSVINGFSDLILELFGPEVGSHARSAVGMAELPFDFPVEIEGEVEILP